MFSLALTARFREELNVEVVTCRTVSEFRQATAPGTARFTLAVVDLTLKDSEHMESLRYASEINLPSIAFTGSFDFQNELESLGNTVVDYVLKDSERVFDAIVGAVKRILTNSNIRVLIVSTDEAERAELRDFLLPQQFLVSEVSTGAEALDKMVTHSDIEIVLIRDKLPDMSHNALVRKIRDEYQLDRVRIIGLVDQGDSASGAEFLKWGASDFVSIPLNREAFHRRVAQNVDTLEKFKELRAAASRDFLTDMYNRRHFFERGPVLVKHCLERGEPVCAAVLDIDHFKKFNDTYGHETGDVVLKVVARRLREIVGDDFHISARLGGEEFGLLFRNMSLKDATDFCDALRIAIAETKILAEEEELSVTISVGLAEILGDETFDNYLNAADQYLYMAKNSGRNCVFSDYSIMQMFAARSQEKSA